MALNESKMEAKGEVVVRGVGRGLDRRGFGWGPWRCDWFSLCSMHSELTPDCAACHSGSYVNRWWNAIDRGFYAVAPGIWRWWANVDLEWWTIKYHLWKKHRRATCRYCGVRTTVAHLYPCDFCGGNDH